MTQIDDESLEALNQIAGVMRDVFDERGHAVSTAIGLDKAFRRSRRPTSALTRDLVIEGMEVGAAQAGVWCDPGPGGSQELHMEVLGRPAVFRLKVAEQRATGDYKIVTNNVSNWGNLDEDTLVYEEPWVFGYTTKGQSIGEVFVAKVLGITEGTPGVLILGHPIILGHRLLPSKGFTPADEELEGFEDLEEIQKIVVGS